MQSEMKESMHSTPQQDLISERDFCVLISSRMQRILSIAIYLERRPLGNCLLTRPLLGSLLSESAQMVELFDAYGARNNREWNRLRHFLAAMKLFSSIGYSLRHIRHSLAFYRLLPVQGDIIAATDDAMLFDSDIIMQLAAHIVSESRSRSIPIPTHLPSEQEFEEELPAGRLANNRQRRRVQSCEETVAYLSTAFLNLAAESDILHVFKNINDSEYCTCIPDPISEESLRMLEHKFHNLQSLYDTNISDTDTESLDPDLPFLRGHVTIIFHLLEIATNLCHYFERHLIHHRTGDTDVTQLPIIEPHLLLQTLVSFPITYCSRYLESAVSLCHKMLHRYAEIGRVSLPVPNYRGFHVRPSTLVAKICHHYGSDVKMELQGETYDASAPLDLFRANEQINAIKRRTLAEEVSRLSMQTSTHLDDSVFAAVREVVQRLAADQKIVIYERPLPIEELHPQENESLSQFIVDEIAHLLALGKIDIESDLTVTFVGDTRVLHDIRILAESGYGEDNFGNNTPLPKELAYLRR